jgi:hypothetical protein
VKLLRVFLVLAVSVGYLSYVFRIFDGQFRSSGLGDWIDPYFINALLEHWYHAVRTMGDPSSLPMFFPARHTLGYSHGLILYAPFYVPLRLFLHPFHAYTATLFLVLEFGILCLYLLFRKMGLSFTESMLLSTFFFTSQNVVNGSTGGWSQRASVFLIPPIALLGLVSMRMRGHPRLIFACATGLLATLLYLQDFYTAHFALLLAAAAAAAMAAINCRPGAFWSGRSRLSRFVLLVAAIATTWTCYVLMYGGIDTRFLGVRLASRDWRRPAVPALAALIMFLALNADVRRKVRRSAAENPWLVAFVTGAIAGAAVFLCIYLPAFREHRGFPEEEIRRALVSSNPFETLRSFKLVAVLGVLACLRRVPIERRVRLSGLWLVGISALVFLAPVKIGHFSLWMGLVGRLPGFGVIRDPKRIIYLYELAVVMATAALLIRFPAKVRLFVAALLLALIVTEPNAERFDFERPIAQFDRWVAAPIDIDPSCASFYIKGASQEYMSRSPHRWALYGVDSVFVALNRSIPTLNGYSAWTPDGWELGNPQEASYPGRVRRWIDRQGLVNVCQFDIDARTIRPGPE